jgi:ABC-type spermidine/putrescine transport system permease subunit II/DNA-binding beta-propeller fold protein YncE
MLWPIAAFTLLGAWQRLQPGQLEVEPELAGFGLIRWLLLPVARPALAQAATLIFVLALNNFAVPATLQVKVLPAAIYTGFSAGFDFVEAAALSWPLVVAPLILLLWLARQEVAWPHLEGAVAASLFRRRLGKAWFAGSSLVTLGVISLAVLMPLGELAATAETWVTLPRALAAGQTALMTSFGLAAVAACLGVGLGLIGWRLPLGPALWLLLLIPGLLLRIGLIYLLSQPLFNALYDSLAMVLLALVLRYLGLGWNGAAQARRSADRDLTDAALLSGASRWQMLWHVHLPQMAPMLAVGWYAMYLLCLWDVETLILVTPPGSETLALRIFSLLHYGHNVEVKALCLLLLFLALLPLVLFFAGNWLWRRPSRCVFAACGGLLATLSLVGCSPGPAGGTALRSQLFSRVEIIGARGTAPGQFNKPRSLTVDAQDNLYVVDMTGRVQKFSSDGQFRLLWQMPETDLGKPKGMTCDGHGCVVVLEPHYARVNHFTSEGRLVRQWGVRGTNVGELAFPRAVVASSRGELFVSEYGQADRVQRFTPEGARVIAAFGATGSGPGQFSRAEGLCVDALDRVYVADSCNHRIQVFSAEGKWLGAHGRAGRNLGELSYPYDVQVDRHGNQFVCEFGNSRIQVFDSRNQPRETIGALGRLPGLFNNPWSIALDSAGNLYVADANNHRVQKLTRRKPERVSRPRPTTRLACLSLAVPELAVQLAAGPSR